MNPGSNIDLALVETLDGGDLQMLGGDMAKIYGRENQPYIAMFGGNRDKSNYWGNLFIPDNYQSETEWTLNNTSLTSSGRLRIESAIKKDLAFLNPDSITVTIISDNKVSCLIKGDFGQTIINFSKNPGIDGDFWEVDFNNDFY